MVMIAAMPAAKGRSSQTGGDSMGKKAFQALREYAAEAMPGVIVLRSLNDQAVRDFDKDRSVAALLRSLLALGMSRPDIHWHVAHPGRYRVCVAGD
jgi:hypothetical protein